jgi:hypothetical protein
MFSFLNTVEVLPIERVNFIVEALAASGLDAAIMLKARTGMPGYLSLNAWMTHSEPISQSIPTEVVCCAGRQNELSELLGQFVRKLQAVATGSLDSRESPTPVGATSSLEEPTHASQGVPPTEPLP